MPEVTEGMVEVMSGQTGDVEQTHYIVMKSIASCFKARK